MAHSDEVQESGIPEQTLPFEELNTEQTSTILFIHGALSSHKEWDLVTPHLQGYHLLLPGLPAHGQAQNIEPFTKAKSAKLLANTIRQHAKYGKAHIIGLSLGAHIAIELMSDYPDVINDAFISGISKFPGGLLTNYIAPRALWLDVNSQKMVPDWLIRWLTDGMEPSHDNTVTSLAKCKDITGILIMTDDERWPKPWAARTLIMSAGKSGILPTADQPKTAVKLRDIARERNAETMAYTHPLMRHAWSRQDPELFARAAKAWFAKEKTPEGFVEL